MKKLLLSLSLALSFTLLSCSKDSSGYSSGGGSNTTLKVVTKTAYDVTSYSFTSGGDLKNHTTQNILEVGICVSDNNPNPSYNDETCDIILGNPANESFTCCYDLGNPGTTYYYRAYVVYGSDTDPILKQGDIKQVTTAGSGSTSVSVTTIPGNLFHYYGDYYLSTGGSVRIINGSPIITERGICYSNYNNNPHYDNYKKPCGSGSGDFNTDIELYDHTTYYYRAYAVCDGTIVYGSVYNVSTGSKTGSY